MESLEASYFKTQIMAAVVAVAMVFTAFRANFHYKKQGRYAELADLRQHEEHMVSQSILSWSSNIPLFLSILLCNYDGVSYPWGRISTLLVFFVQS